MTVTGDAYQGNNGVGRPGYCPGTDEAHNSFRNLHLYIGSTTCHIN